MKFEKIDNLIKEVLKSSKINTTQWKQFTFNSLFEFKKGKTSKYKNLPIGNTNMITTSAKNNGVARKVSINDRQQIFNNCLTMSNNADGYIFWQDEQFAISPDNCLLINRNITRWSGLFISAVWNSLVKSKGYDWNNKTGIAKILNETILLPQDKNGNPDWEYMENFMKSREREMRNHLISQD